MGADYVRHGLVVPVVIDSGIISIGLCHTLWYAVSAWQGSRSRRALRGIFCRRRGRTFQHWIGLLWNQNFYTGSKNQGKQDLEYEWCNMAESTKISSLTRGIPKFDGNALKYEEWKTVTLAVLEISRNDMFEILTGESARPREVYTSPARTDTQNAPVSSGEAADGDSEQAGASDQDTGRAGINPAAVQTTATAAALWTPRNRRSDSPVEIEDSTGDMTAPSGPPLNRNEIRAWEKTNAALYSVLFLTTSGAARCLLRKYETKKGQKADGREAWLALNRKYENTSSHRGRS